MAADTTYFLKILGGEGLAAGGGAGGDRGMASGGMGSSGGKDAKKVKDELKKGNKDNRKGLGATLGIKFGIASLLKQSQVFTGFIGTIFQLMGALVDVILAPFLPILIPGIRLIASLIPYVAKYSQAIYDFLDRTIFQWFRNLPIPDIIKDNVQKALSAILVGIIMLRITGMWNPFKTLVTQFFAKPLWLAAKTAAGIVGDIFRLFGGHTAVGAIKTGAKNAITAAWDATGGKIWTKIGTVADSLVARIWTNGLKPIVDTIKTKVGSLVDDIVRRIWTNGLKSQFTTKILTRLTGIKDFIARPFASLWNTISRNVATAGDGIIGRGLTALRGMPMIATILDFPHVITRYMESLANWATGALSNLLNKLPVVTKLMKWLGKELMGKLGGLLKGAKGVFGAVKGKVAGAAGAAFDTVAPKVGGVLGRMKPSHLLKAAQGFKAIPVLGAVAELGFGAYATYKDFKKYGTKAALGRAALTLANTGTALIDPTGLASAGGSIASNIAMDVAYRKMLDPKDAYKRANPDIWIEVINEDGISTFTKKATADNNDRVNASPGMPKDRAVMDVY